MIETLRKHDSHRVFAGSRPCWKRTCRQPCTPWRERYGTVQTDPGAKRKTTGVRVLAASVNESG